MKNRNSLLYLAGLLLGLGALSAAGQTALQGFAGVGNGTTTLSYYVCSANSAFRGPCVVNYLNGTSDLSSSVVQFYSTGAPTACTYTNSTVTIPVQSTNGVYAASGIIIIRHRLLDSYERRVLTTSTGTTNLVVTGAPTLTVAPGDLIYPATVAGKIPVGAATKEVSSSAGIYVGNTDANGNPYPLLLELNGTSACILNAVSGTYLH